MRIEDIIEIAVGHGWKPVVNRGTSSEVYIDFHRLTGGGVHFCFTAEMVAGKPDTLVEDILMFIDGFEPETYATEWCDKTKSNDYTKYRQALIDMDEMRTEAWLLVYDLITELECHKKLTDLPWWLWN